MTLICNLIDVDSLVILAGECLLIFTGHLNCIEREEDVIDYYCM